MAQRQRGEDTLTVNTGMTIESDEDTFNISISRELRINDTLKYSKTWEDAIPRKLV